MIHRTLAPVPTTLSLSALMLTVVLAFSAGAMADSDPVGKTFWARPGLWETSIDFHADVELRGRVPVYEKRAFMVEGLVMGGPWPYRDPIYRVRFDDGSHAFIDAGDFATVQSLSAEAVAAAAALPNPNGSSGGSSASEGMTIGMTPSAAYLASTVSTRSEGGMAG